MNRLLRLLADNRAVKGARRFEVQAAAEEATVYLYDTIVSSALEAEYWGGVAAEQFVRDFTALTAPVIHLRINSPGGDVFAARAMEQAIRAHKSTVVCHIDGYAASAASFLALAGDQVEISEGGFLMIHQAWAFAMGNANDLKHTATLLEQIDQTIIATYAKRTKMDVAKLQDMLAAETWIGAQEAVDLGFADRIATTEAKDAIDWNVAALRETPISYRDPPEPEDDPAPPRDSYERRMKHYERIAA